MLLVGMACEDLDLRAREEALDSLKREAMQAEPEASGFVFGEGPADAPILLVGEAPGPEEERAGRPFVGMAGRLLNQLLDEAGIRRQDVYITNMVKHRPVRQIGDKRVTRAPSGSEVAAHLSILNQEIAVICPRVIVCLGCVAGAGLICNRLRIGKERGKWFVGPYGIPTIATFHPAAVRRPRRTIGLPLREMVIADLIAAKWAAQRGLAGSSLE